jgi:uncharacterized protein YjbI with pentapeptide repeats
MKTLPVLALVLSLVAVPALAEEAGIRDAFLAGTSRDCPGCDLSGQNLTYRDLSGANLAGANLSKARMHRSLLTRADLSLC